jgi:hypothetical protein
MHNSKKQILPQIRDLCANLRTNMDAVDMKLEELPGRDRPGGGRSLRNHRRHRHKALQPGREP